MSRSSYQFPEVPEEIVAAYRAAHRALESIVPGNSLVPESEFEDINQVISQFPDMVEKASSRVTAYLGPYLAWEADCEKDWELTVAEIDLDDPGNEKELGVKLHESALESDRGGWFNCALDLAARAYKRDAGWDFAPGKAGIWLLMLAPSSGIGGDEEWFYQGRLAGFVILYDRDGDGEYESVGHMWTARGWRRRGIARRLLQEAKSRFGFRIIERPLTKDSAALLRAYPELSG